MKRFEENQFGQLIDNKTGVEVGEERKPEILRILNAHDDLVAALEELRAMCERQRDFNDDGDGKTLMRADAALAKAEGAK